MVSFLASSESQFITGAHESLWIDRHDQPTSLRTKCELFPTSTMVPYFIFRRSQSTEVSFSIEHRLNVDSTACIVSWDPIVVYAVFIRPLVLLINLSRHLYNSSVFKRASYVASDDVKEFQIKFSSNLSST